LLSSEISNANTIYTTVNPSVSDVNFISFLQVEGIGQGLYTYGAIWLLICSMILLLAMLAPIFISKDSK
jgi:NADH-ubiquinone oxidoreductase chain 6